MKSYELLLRSLEEPKSTDELLVDVQDGSCVLSSRDWANLVFHH